ncbi:MAG: hypothetical protein ACREXS_02715 [Gammaproteobacteria bacterium]
MKNWLKGIKDYLAANVEIAPADLIRDQGRRGGGTQAVWRGVERMLDELSEALVA